MKKPQEEILADILERLTTDTDVTDVDPGSVARTFSEVISEQFYEFYTQLDISVAMHFVSTSNGRFLDLIGELLDCKRENGEDDDSYRARITQQVYVVAGANQTAIRLKALSVNGVKDVVLREYTHGAGSFSIYVIVEESESIKSVVSAVQAAVDDVKGFGVYAEVSSPVLISLDLMVRLIFSNEAGSAEKSTIRQGVVNAVREYIRELSLGETFIINETIQRIMDVSDKILDLEIYGMKVDGLSRFINNVTINKDEKIVLDSLEIV